MLDQPPPTTLVLDHILCWTEPGNLPDQLCDTVPLRKLKGLVVMLCASANIFTMCPKEKNTNPIIWHLSPIGGLICWHTFKAAQLVSVGLQETRMKKPEQNPLFHRQYLQLRQADEDKAALNYGSSPHGWTRLNLPWFCLPIVGSYYSVCAQV